MSENTKITVAHGDGIGPEIMAATLKIIEAAGARLDYEEIEIGEKVYLSGNAAGIAPESWDSLKRTKVFLKAPITTPQGGGYKSLNVAVRKTLGLYANVRPCVSYHPFVETKHPVMDVVIVRENEEDLYAGIEYRQTQQVEECLKLMSNVGCEKIIRYAFEYAKKFGRKKVTAFMKDNIMKQTDGMFHRIFDEISEEYPNIEGDHWIIDIGAAKMADTPENFDVIVMPNLYGDILSDVAAQIAGSVGLAGSSNIGEDVAMFEAIHGSAPRRAGQNMANPSGLFLGAILMLLHIGQTDVATKAHNAWLKTIEDGVHTYDMFKEGVSTEKVGTSEFADAVVARIGQKPETLKAVNYSSDENVKEADMKKPYTLKPEQKKELVGVDVFLDWWKGDFYGVADELGGLVEKVNGDGLKLQTIANRGVKVYPDGNPDTFTVDHWRCRFIPESGEGNAIEKSAIISLLQRFNDSGLDVIKTENLYNFDGERGYSV
ncbi:MAG: NADP-dependent isocitrate dehydrogenase [Acidobacteriota bacterium]|jgi:isocitrate dehydrogenase|nr:NADP-dependent isocitrate dehydrogenase [Acidobacteriota bacterium]